MVTGWPNRHYRSYRAMKQRVTLRASGIAIAFAAEEKLKATIKQQPIESINESVSSAQVG